jgi:hypothetical protein
MVRSAGRGVAMPYVMVPVPEEHVLEVMGVVLRLAARRSPDEPPKAWDQEAVNDFFAKANEPTRGLLSFLAHPNRAGKEFIPPDIAGTLELEASEVSGLLGPLKREFRRANRVPLFESRVHLETTVKGRTLKRRRLMMTVEHAQMVRAAEQAVRSMEPDPLAGRAR